MNITCRKTKCKYNKNFVCGLYHLKVGENSQCESFENAEKNVADTSSQMMTKAPKYNPYRSAKKCNICCQANCMFNQKTKCQANGITVNELTEKPYCITFLKK